MTADVLTGGFGDTPQHSARAFRAALTALPRPGTIVTVAGAVPPDPLSIAAGRLILTLCGGTTPVHPGATFDTPLTRDWITFHPGAPVTTAGSASFAIGSWADLAPVSRFATRPPDYPDRSATLNVEMPDLFAEGPRLGGPGIATATYLSLPVTAAFQRNRGLFPQGFDTFLTGGSRLAALPRSTAVEDI